MTYAVPGSLQFSFGSEPSAKLSVPGSPPFREGTGTEGGFRNCGIVDSVPTKQAGRRLKLPALSRVSLWPARWASASCRRPS
jgi:hypothetical protein